MNDALIISDLHLGSQVCRAKEILLFLKKIESKELMTKELILNGDVFDSWDFRRIQKTQWKILSKIRSISKHVKIVWINGNHDGPAEIISHLIGVDVAEEYWVHSDDKNILILHGHMFDEFIAKHPILTRLADRFYQLIQLIDPSFKWARMLKKSSKTFLRCSELIEERALSYAKTKEADFVCCGHTHLAVSHESYFNSGCWTEYPCTYLEICNGKITLKDFTDEIDKFLAGKDSIEEEESHSRDSHHASISLEQETME